MAYSSGEVCTNEAFIAFAKQKGLNLPMDMTEPRLEATEDGDDDAAAAGHMRFEDDEGDA